MQSKKLFLLTRTSGKRLTVPVIFYPNVEISASEWSCQAERDIECKSKQCALSRLCSPALPMNGLLSCDIFEHFVWSLGVPNELCRALLCGPVKNDQSDTGLHYASLLTGLWFSFWLGSILWSLVPRWPSLPLQEHAFNCELAKFSLTGCPMC